MNAHVTPLVHQWHSEHKARQARYAAAAHAIRVESFQEKAARKAREEADRLRRAEETKHALLVYGAAVSLLRGFALAINPRKAIRKISILEIQTTVADYFGVTVHDIISARRGLVVMMPRQIAMYLSRSLTLKSFPEIGKKFGNRDHSTILHGARKIEFMVESNENFRLQINTLRSKLIAPTQGGM